MFIERLDHCGRRQHQNDEGRPAWNPERSDEM